MSRWTAAPRGVLCLVIIAALAGNGCSLLIDSAARKKASQRQRDADTVLKTGATRSAVIEELGNPDESVTMGGARIDTYYLRSIPDPSKASLHQWMMVDLEFLLLPEIVMTPAALYGDYFSHTGSKTCKVTYRSDERITRTDCEDLP